MRIKENNALMNSQLNQTLRDRLSQLFFNQTQERFREIIQKLHDINIV
jgi:hypothetical protein